MYYYLSFLKQHIEIFQDIDFHLNSPLLFLKLYNGTSDKAGFILILVYGFTSFAITLLISHFIQKTIFIPVLSTILALPLFFIFNSSAIVLILIILVFSFIAYGLSSLLK